MNWTPSAIRKNDRMDFTANAVRLTDFEPALDDFAEAVRKGLAVRPKSIQPKYFYDAAGSKLFDQICLTPEYYPTRTELAIMRVHTPTIAALVGPRVRLVEFGSGSSMKTRLLLSHLTDVTSYMPVDISRDHLMEAAVDLAAAYPSVEVLPICADFTGEFTLPEPKRKPARTLVYFPGSTIGNFEPAETQALLRRMAALAGQDGALLIGADLQKDTTVLEAAYDDTQGVTAAFNLNLLKRINNELDGDFDLTRFRHRALYNSSAHRIEMYLESLDDQTVTVGGSRFDFVAGETIHTESSHKYTDKQFEEFAATTGMRVTRVWKDADRLFSVQYLEMS
jgi:dimethylhistidine N-methyltransferase